MGIDNLFLGIWRVYWAGWISSCLCYGLSTDEMVALADFYALISRNIATIALAQRDSSSEDTAEDTTETD